MYPQLTTTGFLGDGTRVRPVGPYRVHTSSTAMAVVQVSGAYDLSQSIITFPSPVDPTLRHPDRCGHPSQDEDFEMLMRKNRRTLELLAR